MILPCRLELATDAKMDGGRGIGSGPWCHLTLPRKEGPVGVGQVFMLNKQNVKSLRRICVLVVLLAVLVACLMAGVNLLKMSSDALRCSQMFSDVLRFFYMSKCVL